MRTITIRLGLLLILVPALLAVGCGGGGGENTHASSQTDGSPPRTTDSGLQPGTQTTPAPPVSAYGTEAPIIGQTLLRFVKAAGGGDSDAMWSLLSEPTQASIGPTLPDFTTGAANEFREGLGTLASTAKVVMSRRLPGAWGIAVVAGEREVDGTAEYFAYGTALIREGGKWKLELGGIVMTELKPDPLAETDETPKVGANVGSSDPITAALIWIDGEPFRIPRKHTTFTSALEGEPKPLAKGRHVVFVFAATELTAAATAWTFNVE